MVQSEAQATEVEMTNERDPMGSPRAFNYPYDLSKNNENSHAAPNKPLTSKPSGQFNPHAHSPLQTRRPGVRTSDEILSRLVMGFVERRVSPQTIADVVLAQILEAETKPHDLAEATCNGILESLAANGPVAGMQEIVIFISHKTSFPRFLSPTATFGSLSSLLLNPFLNLDPAEASYRDVLRVLDSLAKHGIEQLAKNTQFNAGNTSSNTNQNLGFNQSGNLRTAKLKLTNAFKTAHNIMSQVGQICPHLLILRQILLKGVEPRSDLFSQATFSSVRSVIAAIVNTPDHVLVHHSPKDYMTADVRSDDIKKLDFIDEVLKQCHLAETSKFQASFLVEWLFGGCLRKASAQHDAFVTFSHALKIMVQSSYQRIEILKGLVRALQRDLSLLYTENSGPNGRSERLELARNAAQTFFAALYSPRRSQWPWLSKDLISWVLQLPCHPPESRLVTREQVEWLKTMDTREWMEGLGRPPVWVVSEASETAALVFQMAPGHWLQLFAGNFIDTLLREAFSSEFVLSSSHFDFVEFLLRNLRRKSPLFASEVETLICLQILGRAHSNEQNQIKLSVTRLRLQSNAGAEKREQTRAVLGLLTQPHTVEMLGPNPIARALTLLSRCCKYVEIKCRRETEKRNGTVSCF